MQHAGSIAAPDERFAEIYAREQYGRRGESEALWLVPRDAVQEIDEFVDEFDLKYRRVDGYSIKERLQGGARDGAGDGDRRSSGECDRVDLLLAARRRRADPRLAELGVDGDRAVPRGGRRVLVDRAERDRPRAGALRARGARARHRRRRARVRPRAATSTARAPLVELRRLEWARTIARHWLYETADAIRLEALKASDDAELAGIAAKIDREEVYHRIHAEMWIDRLLGSEEGRARLDEALDELWPYALGVLDDELRPELVAARRGEARPRAAGRRARCRAARHEAELAELLEEMTLVRRSAPAGARW